MSDPTHLGPRIADSSLLESILHHGILIGICLAIVILIIWFEQA